MTDKEKKFLHIGADLEDVGLVEKFRDYCLKEDFKQKTLIQRLVEWWLKLPEPVQWLIYRGKIPEAHSQIASAQAAIDDENAAASASEDLKRKPGRRRPSKIG